MTSRPNYPLPALLALVIGIAITVTTTPAYAYENASFWPKVRIASKICFASHEHYGESPSWPSKPGATAAAIRAWINVTRLEYGARWADYKKAVGKSMTCSQTGNRWLCKTIARPCSTIQRRKSKRRPHRPARR